jgi:hypothetical protein
VSAKVDFVIDSTGDWEAMRRLYPLGKQKTNPTMRLRELVVESFSAESSEQAEKYIDRLLSVWTEYAKTGQRYSIILLLAMISFELINRSIVTEFSIGAIKVVDVSVIHAFLPVLVSFLMFKTLVEFVRWRHIENVYNAVMRQFHPALYKNDFQLLLYPPSSLLGNAFTRKEFGSSAGMLNFSSITQKVLGFLYTLAAAIFVVYSYEQLFAHHSNPIIFDISAALSALLFGAYIVELIIIFFTKVLKPQS